MKTQKISIEGMSCSHCVASVTAALKEQSGVTDVKVSLENKNATVVFDENIVSCDTLVQVIEDIGFEAHC